MPFGYGQRYCIYADKSLPTILMRNLGYIGDPIADVQGSIVELFHPQYYSDFEGLLQKFELEEKRECKLIYWEG